MASTLQSEPLPPSTTPSYLSLELHSQGTINDCPHFPALIRLINHAFGKSHTKNGRSFFPPHERTRLQKDQQLGEEVGPDGFTFIMLEESHVSDTEVENPDQETHDEGFISSTGQRVIGTASAKPYTVTNPTGERPGDDRVQLFKRASPPPSLTPGTNEDNVSPQWEILIMAVDPTLQGRGHGTQLLNLTVDEIRKRCGLGLRDTTAVQDDLLQGRKKEVMLLLSTLQEVNEEYYAKRGWTTTATKKFPPGTKGSRDGFGIVEMYKTAELVESIISPK